MTMFDHLEVAWRRFERIRPAATPCSAWQAQELSLWLQTEVCQVVEDLVQRPDFRRRARWPLQELGPGANSEERSLVDAADGALVECARRLAAGAHQPANRGALLRIGPYNALLPQGDSGGQESNNVDTSGLPIPLGLPTIEFIAGRPWHDLVSRNDYFYPVSDLNLFDRKRYLGPASAHVQIGEFLPYCNPRLRLLGDFVSRTLLIRIEYWQSILQRFLVRCQSAQQILDPQSDSWWRDAVESLHRSTEAYEELCQRCLAGNEGRVRGACILLLQVYATYRPRAELTWLGVPLGTQRQAGNIRDRLERRFDTSIGEQVAAALLEVTPFYRSSPSAEDILAEKVCAHALVVVMGRVQQKVHWYGNLVNTDWSTQRAQWDFFTTLVERAKTGQGVDASNLSGDAPTRLKDRRSRLKTLLPEDLDARIRVAGRGTYKLNLRPEEICLLQYQEDERLVELASPRAEI